MRDYKNIDRIFQENLKDLEVFPPNKSWNSIEKKLGPTSKRRHIPIWVKISSAAAFLLLFFSIGAIYLIPSNKISSKFFIDKLNKKENLFENDSTSKVIIKKTKPSVNSFPSIPKELKKNSNLTDVINPPVRDKESSVEESLINKKVLNKYLLADAQNLPLENNEAEILKKGIPSSKFTVATIFAPIYINSIGDGSGVDSQFKNNPTSGNSSFSYGVKLAYQLNNKFSLQSGINLINLGYTTSNIYVNSGVTAIGFSNLSNEPIAARTDNISTSKVDTFNNLDSNKGNLNQVFGYVEIPVELKYSVTDGKFGLNLVGGFSTLLLNKDEVFIETNSISQSLGASNNLRSINFSGNIGVDVDYLIHKNLYINVSPMFKIQTNTFSKNSGSIQPYYLGVYTGLNYKF